MKKADINLKKIAYATIKQKVLQCEYKPGDILSETMLMEDIDSSRTPIREALNMLAQEQLVQIIPKKGIVILPLTVKEIAMNFEARMLIESYIVENYSNYIDRQKLMDLEARTRHILEQEIHEQKDSTLFCNLDDDLHRTIANACKNKFLSITLSQIYDQNMRIRILGKQNIWERHKIAAGEHLELIHFLQKNDIPSAVASIRIHLIHSKEAAFASFLSDLSL